MIAVAQLRSNFLSKKVGDEIGPYRLLQGEWDAFKTDQEFDFNFDSASISDWSMQIALFALMVFRAQNALTAELGRDPIAAELYLAQLVGAKAAAAAIKTPGDPIFKDIAAADLPAGGKTAPEVCDRYAALLKDGGAPVTGVVALARAVTALQAGLTATAQLAQDSAVPQVTPSTQVNGVAPSTGPDVPVAAPTTGNVVGKLTNADWQVYCNVLGKRESSNNYHSMNQFGYSGRWQFGAEALITVGLVKSGVTQKGLADPSSWKGPAVKSRDDWRNNKAEQDAAMIVYTQGNLNFLQAKGMKPSVTMPQMAGLLAAAHLKGAGNAMKLMNNIITHDANGTSTISYYQLLNKALGGDGKLP